LRLADLGPPLRAVEARGLPHWRKGGALREGRGVRRRAHGRDREGDPGRPGPPRRRGLRPRSAAELERARGQSRGPALDRRAFAPGRPRLRPAGRPGLRDHGGTADADAAPPRDRGSGGLYAGREGASAAALLRQQHRAPVQVRRSDVSLTNSDSSTLTIDTTSAPQKAAQKPSTWKPTPSDFAIALVKSRITALMTKVKRPSVRMRSGQVRTVRSGRSRAFKRPKTSATRSR